MADKKARYDFEAASAKGAARDIMALVDSLERLKRAEAGVSRSTSRIGGGGQKDAHVRARALVQKEQERAANQAAKAHERAARATERAEARATAAVQREAKRRADAYRREGEAEAKKVQRIADAQRRAQYRRQPDRMRARRSPIRAEGDSMGGVANMALAGVPAVIGGLAIAGSDAAVRERMLQDKRARALAVSGGDRSLAPQLLREATDAALAVRGTKTEDVIEGQSRYVAMTGDLKGARSLGKTMATAARATGATEADIAATMATFQQKFGITDEKGQQQALAMMRVAGQQGAFEIGDAAAYYTEMGAAGSRFGLDKGAGGVGQLNALAQLAMSSTKSGAEASTGVSAMLRQLTAKSDEIRQMNGGKEVVFADKGKTRTNDVVDVLVGTLKASKGNRAKLQSVFGDEGMKGATEAIRLFTEAGQKLGPAATEAERLAAGEKAVRDAFSELSGAGANWADVQKDAATMTATSADAMTTAWQTVVAGVGDKLAPSIDRLAEQFLKAAPALIAMSGGAEKALTSTARFAESLGAIATKLGIEMPGEGAGKKAELADVVKLDQAEKRRAVLQTRINNGLASPDEIAEHRRLGGEIEAGRKKMEEAFDGQIQSVGQRRRHEKNVKAGIKDDWQDIGQAKFDPMLLAGQDAGLFYKSSDIVQGTGPQKLAPGRGDPTSFSWSDYTGGGLGPIPAILDKLSTTLDAASGKDVKGVDKLSAVADKLGAAADRLGAANGGRAPTSLPGT